MFRQQPVFSNFIFNSRLILDLGKFLFRNRNFQPIYTLHVRGKKTIKKFRIIILIFMFRIFFVYFISFISFCGLNAFEVFFLLPDVVITDIISYTRSRPNCFFLDYSRRLKPYITKQNEMEERGGGTHLGGQSR